MITVEDILASGGKREWMIESATEEQRANATVLVERVNLLLAELGVSERIEINDGLRPQNARYGAPKSAHKEGKAVDLKDPQNTMGLKITNALLKKFKLRREDTDFTPHWCHLDTREPYGVFKP